MNPSLSRLLSRVASYYKSALDNSPKARERLASLGVTAAAILDRFSVGYVDGNLVKIVPRKGDVSGQLQELGVLDAKGKERFVGSIAIPIPNDTGQVIQIAYYPKDRKLAWLFDETSTWWNAACLKHSPAVTLVSDPLKGLVLVGQGTVSVIAPGGPAEKSLGQAARDMIALYKPQITIAADVPDSMAKQLRESGAAVDRPGKGKEGLSQSVEKIVEQDANGFTLEFPHRVRFIVQGIIQDSPRHLRASVKALLHRKQGDVSTSPRLHLDTLDLYHAKSRTNFSRTAAIILGLDPVMLEEFTSQVVLACERFLREKEKAPAAVVLSAKERDEAMRLLTDPKLLDRISDDMERLGLVGEELNRTIAYIASVSRKLSDPLSVLIVSRSGAGKSTLAEMVMSLCPTEDLLRVTRLTPQTLYYQKPNALKNKLIVVDEESGIAEAGYALRILQSAGKLSLSTAAGYGTASLRQVVGPASIFLTTTKTGLDEETAGRFVTLSTDESAEQTERILKAQRLAEMRPETDRDHTVRLHQNAQRLIEARPVVNLFADQLSFPHQRLSARRDQKKYLALIRAVALLRQHQRKIDEKTGAVLVDAQDIEIANRLANEALGQSIHDLTPPSRKLLFEIREWLKRRPKGEKDERNAGEFSQRELRDQVGWKKTQLALHMKELVGAEYLLMHAQNGKEGRRVRYTLDWDGQGLDGEKLFRGGLIRPASDPLPGHDRSTSGIEKTKPRSQESHPNQESGPHVRISEKENR